ncbi:MAG: class I SAM-dependent methyltransferase [Myxococcota bacterium]|nr:class I SAM-dependent methyltransferase [Myxococcota bacterium]
MANRWDDLVNAETYADHVDDWRVYRELNQALATALHQDGEVASVERLLDVGCGTGATLEAFLRVLPFELEVIAVDSAQAMVERARELVPDPRIEWQVAQGEECAARYTNSFDLITCGAAFWHLDPHAYAAMMDALRPKGRLVFNVPVAQCARETATRHPIQAAIADLLAEQRGTFPAIHPRFDRRAFDVLCDQHGRSCAWTPFRWRGPQGALVDLLKIPAMGEMVAPGLSQQDFDRLIRAAEGRVDRDQSVVVDWWLGLVGAVSR